MVSRAAKKLREQVDQLPLDSKLKAAVLEGVDHADDETAAQHAATLKALFDRLPSKLQSIREAVARDESLQHRTASTTIAKRREERQPAPAPHRGGVRRYEVLFILSPKIDEEAATALIENLKKIAEDNGAVVVNEEAWGRRRLAYPIHKFNEGIYHLFVFETDSSLSELDRRMKNVDTVLRHVIVRTDLDQKRAEKLARRNPKKERERPARDEVLAVKSTDTPDADPYTRIGEPIH